MAFEQQQELVARARQARSRAVAETMAALVGSMRRAWVGWRTRAELSSLSDRTLRDIGLNRGEIGSLHR